MKRLLFVVALTVLFFVGVQAQDTSVRFRNVRLSSLIGWR